MTDQSAAPGADPTQTETMVPAAALTSMQEQLTAKDAELAAQTEAKAAAEAQAAAAQDALAKALAAMDALKAAKEAAEVKAEALSSAANFARASTKARRRIMLDEARDGTEPKEVDVGVNGRVYKIKRNVWVDVPPEVVSVLDDAVIGRAEPVLDERTGISAGVVYRNARRFPFRDAGQSVDDDGNLLPGFDPLPH